MAQAEVEGGSEHGDDIDFTFDGGAEQIDMEDFDFELDGGDVLQEGTVPGDQEVGEDFVAGQNEVGEVDEIGYEDIIGTNSQQLTENEGSNTSSAQLDPAHTRFAALPSRALSKMFSGRQHSGLGARSSERANTASSAARQNTRRTRHTPRPAPL